MFLRYGGTAGLTVSLGFGDLTGLQYSAQRAVTEWAAQLPTGVLPMVAFVAAWRRRPTAIDQPSAERASVDTH